jgi:predicted transcriptional regulator of viral defense system
MPTLIRPRDLPLAGISAHRFRNLVRSGAYERVSRGLYLNPESDYSELLTIAEVVKQVPDAIICLYSALELHGIGTQWPKKLWIAIDRKARIPRLRDFDVRIVRFSGPMLTQGLLERITDGVQYRITSPARTIVDCFRYRMKFGLDAALEALKDGLRSRKVAPSEIDALADACRIRTVIRPYMEAVLA